MNYTTNKLLIKVGISPDLKGYHYLVEAINIAKEALLNNKVNENFTILYTSIAKKFDTTSNGVERAMRHSIAKAFKANNSLLHEIFKTLTTPSGNVTNSCFVYTLAQHLIITLEDDGLWI